MNPFINSISLYIYIYIYILKWDRLSDRFLSTKLVFFVIIFALAHRPTYSVLFQNVVQAGEVDGHGKKCTCHDILHVVGAGSILGL